MSIRYLAQELYRLERAAGDLRKKLEQARPGEQAELEDKLRQVMAERNEWRAMLDAKKEPPTHKTTFK
ncbi:MAG: hypothetical protein V1816_16820 [Pseudomonadota bacterium]